jgi:hypothetical protein
MKGVLRTVGVVALGSLVLSAESTPDLAGVRPRSVPGQEGRAQSSTAAVVKAATEYVADYQRRLTSILADESYVQDVVRQIPRDPNGPRTRRMVSEVFFMFTPGSNDWMAIRDVIAVDGQPVPNRPDIKQALEALSSTGAAATLKARNSRFNIGRIVRNFSEPTLSLLIFDDTHRGRFSFERKHVRNEADAVLVTLAFAEKKSPTLIADVRRGRIFSSGEVIVEAGTGRVRHTALRAKSGDIALELTTEYSPDEQLAMWVPAVFRESYERGDSPKGLESDSEYEHVVCEARYRNFRRFQTSARIK